jgi:hypothetical protein
MTMATLAKLSEVGEYAALKISELQGWIQPGGAEGEDFDKNIDFSCSFLGYCQQQPHFFP